MKITLYDFMQRIQNGDIPCKVIYKGKEYEYLDDNDGDVEFISEDGSLFTKDFGYWVGRLDEELEIIDFGDDIHENNNI